MEIVLKDIYGTESSTLALTQWDIGQRIYVRDWHYDTSVYMPIFHFCNRNSENIVPYPADISEPVPGEIELSALVPDILLAEPYPIMVYIYLATTNDDYLEHFLDDNGVRQTIYSARTIFISSISVEPRLRPDDYVEDDNFRDKTVAQIQEEIFNDVQEFKAELDRFYGDQLLYENLLSELSESEESWDGTVIGAIQYCKTKAEGLNDDWNNTIQQHIDNIQQEFSNALDGYQIRISNTPPTSSSYSGETNKNIITFVINTQGG